MSHMRFVTALLMPPFFTFGHRDMQVLRLHGQGYRQVSRRWRRPMHGQGAQVRPRRPAQPARQHAPDLSVAVPSDPVAPPTHPVLATDPPATPPAAAPVAAVEAVATNEGYVLPSGKHAGMVKAMKERGRVLELKSAPPRLQRMLKQRRLLPKVPPSCSLPTPSATAPPPSPTPRPPRRLGMPSSPLAEMLALPRVVREINACAKRRVK